MRSEVSSNLKKLRLEHHETQADIMRLLNITAKTLHAYEVKTLPIRSDFLPILAAHYHVSTDYLLDLTDYRSPEADDLGKLTGLSEDGLKGLAKLSPKQKAILSRLLRSPSFGALLHAIRAFFGDAFVVGKETARNIGVRKEGETIHIESKEKIHAIAMWQIQEKLLEIDREEW